MDATAQLALLTKAKLVFESENTFLSFPVLSPLTYPVDRLRFGAGGGADTPQELADLSEFARVVNRIPHGVIAPVEDEYLWDVYADVLGTAELATNALTAEERSSYDSAVALLYSDVDGVRYDSELYRRYKSYRDAHIKAQEEYRNLQLTAEASTDPVVKADWATREPALREAVSDVLAEWEAKGARSVVDAARQTAERLAARAPAQVWDEWRDALNSDLDQMTDTNQVRFAATTFSPYDLFDLGEWPRFTLTADEIVQLCRAAPAELTTVLGSGGASALEGLSFEYRSVSVTRSWLRPEIFGSRFWRLAPGASPLSAGSEPPSGRCPAYIVALVFARNIEVRWRQKPADEEAVLRPEALVRLSPPLLKRLQPMTTAALLSSTAATSSARVARPIQLASALSRVGPVRQLVRRPHPAVVRGFSSLRADLVQVAAGPAPAPTTTTPAQVDRPASTDITILGFICKRIPRCPDPDESLTWQ